MSNPYEVEHNITGSNKPKRRRQIDMSTFNSHLNSISTAGGDASSPEQAHNNPHALPTPVDMAALFGMVQDQLGTLMVDAPNAENRELLTRLMEMLNADIDNPPEEIKGVTQEYLDTLDRVPKKQLGKEDSCPICTERYLDDQYPLVVELPCHGSHKFDLECVGPWLLTKGSCPLCRKNLTDKKKKEKAAAVAEDEEEIDDGGMYA